MVLEQLGTVRCRRPSSKLTAQYVTSSPSKHLSLTLTKLRGAGYSAGNQTSHFEPSGSSATLNFPNKPLLKVTRSTGHTDDADCAKHNGSTGDQVQPPYFPEISQSQEPEDLNGSSTAQTTHTKASDVPTSDGPLLGMLVGGQQPDNVEQVQSRSTKPNDSSGFLEVHQAASNNDTSSAPSQAPSRSFIRSYGERWRYADGRLRSWCLLKYDNNSKRVSLVKRSKVRGAF